MVSQSSNWIDLKTAAERSNKSEGHLRRICGDKWMGEGLARLEQPLDGKSRSAWFVREDADPAFARIKFADQLTKQFDMRTVPEKARNRANDRQRIVEAWQADLAAGRQLGLTERKVTSRFIDKMLIEQNRTISRPTLFNWARAARDGIGALINVYGNGSPASSQVLAAPDHFFDAVRDAWLRQSRPPLKTCYDYCRLQAEHEGWPVYSLKTMERKIKAIPRQVVIKMRYGASAFDNQVLPPATRDYSSIDTNAWWCSDHHQFDVVVRITGADGKHKFTRPWLTCWQDLRSRKIVGWHIFAHDPNQSTILLSLRAGILAEGIPDRVLIDNGKDYDSFTLQGLTKKQRRKIKVDIDAPAVGGVLGTLKIKLTHAIAYNAKAKPVERFFGTVCSQFSKFQATYCGRNPQEKPENLPDQLARANGNAVPTLEELADKFGTWLDCWYHQNVHTGDSMDGLCPAVAFGRFLVRRKVARTEELQLLIAKTSKPLICDKEGVCWGGMRYGKGDPSLYDHFRKKIFLRIDPDDALRAAAYTLEDVFIADLAANIDMPFGATDEDYRRAERERRNIRELTNKYLDLGPKRTADTMELMQIHRAELAAQRALPANPPPSLMPVRTPLEGQSIPLRKAVGAEASPRLPHIPKQSILLSLRDAVEPDDDEPAQKRGSILFALGGNQQGAE